MYGSAVYWILVCGIIICVMPEDRQLWKNILPHGRLMNTCKYNIRCSTDKRKKVIRNDIDNGKVWSGEILETSNFAQGHLPPANFASNCILNPKCKHLHPNHQHEKHWFIKDIIHCPKMIQRCTEYVCAVHFKQTVRFTGKVSFQHKKEIKSKKSDSLSVNEWASESFIVFSIASTVLTSLF